MYDRSELKADLKAGVLELVYRREDGTTRPMRATLFAKFVPKNEAEALKESLTYKDPDKLKVWDHVNKGWRTIVVDRVEYVQSVVTE